MIAVAFLVPLVDGKPDVDLPPSVHVDKSDLPYVTITHLPTGEVFAARFLGTFNGQAALAGMASANVIAWLVRQDFTGARIRDVPQVFKDWLQARGVTRYDVGHTVFGWTRAGDDPGEP